MRMRKSRSPREILSYFGDMMTAKKNSNKPRRNILSILQDIPTNGKTAVKEPHCAPAPKNTGRVPAKPPPDPSPRWLREQQPVYSTPKAALPKQPKSSRFSLKALFNTMKQKRMVILIPILFILLVFVLNRNFGILGISMAYSGRPNVSGVLYNEENPSAVIGNRVVYEGDKVADSIIVKIDRDSVEFERNGQRWTQKVKR